MPVRNKTHSIKSPFDSSQGHKRQNDRRGTSHERGYGAAWQKHAKLFLAEYPWCIACLAAPTPSVLVDHIVPVEQGGESECGSEDPLFFSRTNHQPLCRQHHAIKTPFDGECAKSRAFAIRLMEAFEAGRDECLLRDDLLVHTALWSEWMDLSMKTDRIFLPPDGRALVQA